MKVIKSIGAQRGFFRRFQVVTEKSAETEIQQARQVQRISVRVEVGIYSPSRNLDSNFSG